MAKRPGPMALWQQAAGDTVEYARLMREHGHIVDREKDEAGNLIYDKKEMGELLLLTYCGFATDFKAEHGREPTWGEAAQVLEDVQRGKVVR